MSTVVDSVHDEKTYHSEDLLSFKYSREQFGEPIAEAAFLSATEFLNRRKVHHSQTEYSIRPSVRHVFGYRNFAGISIGFETCDWDVQVTFSPTSAVDFSCYEITGDRVFHSSTFPAVSHEFVLALDEFLGTEAT